MKTLEEELKNNLRVDETIQFSVSGDTGNWKTIIETAQEYAKQEVIGFAEWLGKNRGEFFSRDGYAIINNKRTEGLSPQQLFELYLTTKQK